MTKTELQERLGVLNAGRQEIRRRTEEEKRDLTTEEAAELDQTLDACDRATADLDRLERLEQQTELLTNGRGRKTEAEQPATLEDDGAGESNVQLTRQRPPSRERTPERVAATYLIKPLGNWNFQSLGDFAKSVHRAAVTKGDMDRRLQVSEKLAAASTYGSEGSGADGGFAVPPDFRTAIMQTIMGEDSLLSRCDQVTVSGNNFTCPVDETTPWQTSGGILCVWDGEAVAGTQSKPNLGERTVKLNKLRALVPMTEELLEDASAMDSYLRKKAPDKIGFKVNLALIQGTGVGQPLGILNSGALVTVAKESGQVASTIVANNIFKMYNRMYGPLRSEAVWVYNQEIEPQLYKLSVPGTDNTGNAVTGWGGLVYIPPGGISAAPFGSLMGRPAIPTQACPALSSAGDICFVNFQQYLAIVKGGPNPKVDVSMHLWFDQDLTAFKFTLRMGGVPWWSTTAGMLAGSNTYSPYVALGAR